MRFAIDTAYAQCDHLSLLAVNPPGGAGQEKLLELGVLDLEAPAKIRVYGGHHAALKVQIAAILLGNTRDIHESGKGWFHLLLGENEDFRRGDGVEPFLDPAPYGREERRCSNDLIGSQTAIPPGTQRESHRDATIGEGLLTNIRSSVSG